MIKNIIYVEDGSVDVDMLTDELDETTKVIIYRQGSHPPILVQPDIAINNYTDSIIGKNNKQFEYIRTQLEKAMQLKMSNKLMKILDEIYTNTFC